MAECRSPALRQRASFHDQRLNGCPIIIHDQRQRVHHVRSRLGAAKTQAPLSTAAPWRRGDTSTIRIAPCQAARLLPVVDADPLVPLELSIGRRRSHIVDRT